MTCKQIETGFVCSVPTFEKGDPPPSGYIARAEWAQVQIRAGLRQVSCGICGKYKFPQELGDFTIGSEYQKTKNGPYLTRTKPICKDCTPQDEVKE